MLLFCVIQLHDSACPTSALATPAFEVHCLLFADAVGLDWPTSLQPAHLPACPWKTRSLLHCLQAMSGSLLLECSAILRQQGFLDPSAKLLDEHQALAGQSEVNKQARLRLMLSQVISAPPICFNDVLEVTQCNMQVTCFSGRPNSVLIHPCGGNAVASA